MNAKQEQIYELLRGIFPGKDRVQAEWHPRRNATDWAQDREIYVPRPDIAVGPFNLTPDRANVERIQCESQHWLIDKIKQLCECQNGRCDPKPNPRCLLAIEIEFSGPPKYILGDFTNASVLGYVGVVIGSSKKFDVIRRVGKYANSLRLVEKADPGLFTNTACFEAEAFVGLLESNPRGCAREKTSN